MIDTFICVNFNGLCVRVNDTHVYIQRSTRTGVESVCSPTRYSNQSERDLLISAAVIEALRLDETAEEIRLAEKIAAVQSP